MARKASRVTNKVRSAIDRFDELNDQADALAPLVQDRMGIMGEVRMIGSALVLILIIVLVLTEVYDAVDVGEGPFSGVVDDLETTGVAALSLLIVGLLIVAASAIMRFMSGGFGAGR